MFVYIRFLNNFFLFRCLVALWATTYILIVDTFNNILTIFVLKNISFINRTFINWRIVFLCQFFFFNNCISIIFILVVYCIRFFSIFSWLLIGNFCHLLTSFLFQFFLILPLNIFYILFYIILNNCIRILLVWFLIDIVSIFNNAGILLFWTFLINILGR